MAPPAGRRPWRRERRRPEWRSRDAPRHQQQQVSSHVTALQRGRPASHVRGPAGSTRLDSNGGGGANRPLPYLLAYTRGYPRPHKNQLLGTITAECAASKETRSEHLPRDVPVQTLRWAAPPRGTSCRSGRAGAPLATRPLPEERHSCPEQSLQSLSRSNKRCHIFPRNLVSYFLQHPNRIHSPALSSIKMSGKKRLLNGCCTSQGSWGHNWRSQSSLSQETSHVLFYSQLKTCL